MSDTGIGMTTEQVEDAVKPFNRAQNPYVRQSDGFGLGLAICDRIARAHGGQLDIVSRPGAGTTVSLVFPAHRVAHATPRTPEVQVSG